MPRNFIWRAGVLEPREVIPVADDALLIQRIDRGDQHAFGELVERHARYLYGVAYALVGNAADAEDVVQETFVAVLNGRFRGESSVRTWLVGIAVRQSALVRRGRQRRSEGLTEMAARASRRAVVPPEASAIEARLDVAAMLEGLSPEHRQVIVLRELEAMSYEEMAQVLGVPRGTVESRLFRARAELRRLAGGSP